MDVVKRIGNAEHGYQYWFMCPGCGKSHAWGDQWQFNGDYERPTVSPSLLVHWGPQDERKTCHSFIKDGMIRFLNDCWHDMAGKTVPIPELPEWLREQ